MHDSDACPSPDTLARFTQGLLDGDELERFERHLAGCVDCVREIEGITGHDGETAPAAEDDLALGLLRRGSSVGRYLVLDVLGSGGMGVIYAGYDPALDRKVALKLVRPTPGQHEGPDRGDTLRLLGEAQALARVSHPNVTAIYDVGSVGDRVFLAIERVDGGTLRQWLGQPRRWPELRDVFLAAGRGLCAAHAVGVVHRDFKPENVLVGSDGRVRVNDFGLARAQREPAEAPSAAPEGTVGTSGTPGYIAPEVLAGKPADARSDQYSFCVSLYEALHGRRPDPSAPSAPPRVNAPAHVRAALRRGLSADPADRFETLEALLTALGRDPRRRLIPLGVVLAAGAVSAATFFATHVEPCAGVADRMGPVWNAPRRDRLRAAFGKTGLPFAADAWSAVEQTLSSYAARWGDARTAACTATHVRHEQSPEALDLRMACLDRRAAELEQLLLLLENADAKEVEKAPEAALNLVPVERCADVEALKQTDRPPSDPAKRASLEAIRQALSQARGLLALGKPGPALEAAEQQRAAAQTLAYLPVVAELDFLAGSAKAESGDLPGAAERLNAAAIAAELGHDVHLETQAWVREAMVLGPLQRQPQASRFALSHARALLPSTGDDGALEAEALDVEAQLVYLDGKLDEALALATRALQRLERKPGLDDRRAFALHSFAGFVRGDLGHFDAAMEDEQRALAGRQKAFGAGHPEVARSLTNLALVQQRAGELDPALANFRQAQTVWSNALGPKFPLVGFAQQGEAEVLLELGRLDEAQRAADAAVAVLEQGYGPEHPRVASALASAGRVSLRRGALDDAWQRYQRALVLFKGPGSSPARRSLPLTGLGQVLLARHQPREALPLLEEAVSLLEGSQGEAAERAEAHLALADALWEAGDDRARSLELAGRARAEAQNLSRALSTHRQVEAWWASHPVTGAAR